MSEQIEQIFDLVVIGSGPGGYVGAIRAAQLGLKTAIVEKDPTYGGTCLNVGCIPSKALLESSEHYQAVQHDLKNHGIEIEKFSFDLKQMMSRKDKVVQQNTEGIAFLFKKNKITPFRGTGKIISAMVSSTQANSSAQTNSAQTNLAQVEVTGSDNSKKLLSAKNIMIATGSSPAELPFLKFDEEIILSNTGALALKKVPKDMLVIGGGVIGLELGSVWARLGTKVTIIEYSDRLGGTTDPEAMQVLKKNLQKEGIEFLLSTKVFAAQKQKTGVELEFESLKDGSKGKLKAAVVLVATGRRPFTQGLGCEEVGITKDPQGRILVNAHYQTQFSNIYAIGDVIHGPMLAHKAEEEGVAVAEIIAGHAGHVNYNTVPSVIYTHPEIAAVGITEEQATKDGLVVNVGKFPFLANGRARAKGFTEGFAKIIADKKTDKILGATIVGPNASELIHEIIVCMEFGGSSEDLARSFHAHPTLSEVVREAALAVEKRQRQM